MLEHVSSREFEPEDGAKHVDNHCIVSLVDHRPHLSLHTHRQPVSAKHQNPLDTQLHPAAAAEPGARCAASDCAAPVPPGLHGGRGAGGLV